MKQLTELLISQTKDSYQWTTQLIRDIENDTWFIAPAVVESTIAWQIGHLTLSQYYYTVVLLTGPDKEFAARIDLKKYSALFATGARKNEIAAEFSVEQLKQDRDLLLDKTMEVLHSINDMELGQAITRMPKEHPFVKTKQDSISWNIQHTMWHCGQIGMIKRVVDKAFDFGL